MRSPHRSHGDRRLAEVRGVPTGDADISRSRSEQSCAAGRASFITGQSGLRTGLTKVALRVEAGRSDTQLHRGALRPAADLGTFLALPRPP
jgi:hypothetical protein